MLHKRCGHIAFWMHDPKPGDLVTASNIMLVNGERGVSGDELVCGHCSRSFGITEIVRG